MNDELLEPLQYFQNIGQKKHFDLTNEYFDELVAKSGIDVEQNRATVRAYKEQMTVVNDLSKKISKNKTYRLLIIIGLVLAAIICLSVTVHIAIRLLMIAAAGTGAFYGIKTIVKKINPVIKDFQSVLEQEQQKADEILAEAKAQTAPLNALFDDKDIYRIIEKTIPEFKFHNSYNTELDGLFRTKNDFLDLTDEETSVVNTLSGTYMDNPFLFQRVKEHNMGTETYHGELEISWIEYYTDSNGNRCSRRRYQTLYASVVKPKPYYVFRTYLHYGAQGAPDLTFSRKSKHIEGKSEKSIERMVKSGEKQLQKKERKAVKTGETFTGLANTEFDVLFGATDRDNEVQFRMMYTPLAQVETVKMLKSTVAYGDDFDFYKNGKFNTIMSDHGQNWDMNTNPEKYYDYDIDVIRDKFTSANTTFFKSVFFDFAPLLAVPLYQQRPVKSLEDIEKGPQNYTFNEYECMANSIDYAAIAHPETETDVIVKAAYSQSVDNTDIVELNAYSYTTVERVDYVSVLGGDGNYHNVPVLWLEYIPLSRTTYMALRDFKMSRHEFDNKLNTPFGEEILKYSGRCGYCHDMFGFILDENDSVNHLETLANKY